MRVLFLVLMISMMSCGKNNNTPIDTPRQAPENERRQTNDANETLSDLKMVLVGKILMMNKILVNGFELEIDECRKDDEVFINQNGTFKSIDHQACEDMNTDAKGSYEFYIQAGQIFLVLNDQNGNKQEFRLLSYGLESISFQTQQEIEGETYDVEVTYLIKKGSPIMASPNL